MRDDIDDKLAALFRESEQPVCIDEFISDCHDKLMRSQKRSAIVKLFIIIVMLLAMLIITPFVIEVMVWIDAQLGTQPTVAKSSASVIYDMNLSSIINQVLISAGIIISVCIISWIWFPGFYSKH